MTDPENTPKADPKTETPATPPTPEPKADPPKKAEPKPAEPEPWDEERARNTIKAQREAEEKLKAELKDAKKAQAELQKIKDAEKTELERAQQEAGEATAELQATRKNLQDANLRVALVGKVADADLAATALKERGLEFDEQGKPQGLDEAVEKLLEDKPLLRGQGDAPTPTPSPTDAGAGQGGGPGPSLTAEQLKAAQTAGMSAQEYALIQKAIDEEGIVSGERWQQIQAQLAAAKT